MEVPWIRLPEESVLSRWNVGHATACALCAGLDRYGGFFIRKTSEYPTSTGGGMNDVDVLHIAFRNELEYDAIRTNVCSWEVIAALIHKAYKGRIDSNRSQRERIAKTIGCCRFVFNHFPVQWNGACGTTGKGLSSSACCARMTVLKKEPGTVVYHPMRQWTPCCCRGSDETAKTWSGQMCRIPGY